VTELEQDLCEFFSITTIEEEPELWQHAARKSGGYESVTPAQRAWLFRVAELASAVKTHSFTEEALAGAIEELRALHRSEKGVEEVACVLASAGVRFLIVEHLKSTKIDGACLWLGHSTPIVALTLRYDRIDWFWHTLMHELGHVKNSDGRYKPLMPDTNLVGRDSIDRQEKPLIERRADRFASEQLIPRTKIASFLRRTEHFLSKDRIRVFAESVGVHPGIVVGRLQHMERVPYSHYREMLVRVRDRVVKSTMTDGWGHSPK
jgi:HTH-type transcriptional regulator/antitoxin HigA